MHVPPSHAPFDILRLCSDLRQHTIPHRKRRAKDCAGGAARLGACGETVRTPVECQLKSHKKNCSRDSGRGPYTAPVREVSGLIVVVSAGFLFAFVHSRAARPHLNAYLTHGVAAAHAKLRLVCVATDFSLQDGHARLKSHGGIYKVILDRAGARGTRRLSAVSQGDAVDLDRRRRPGRHGICRRPGRAQRVEHRGPRRIRRRQRLAHRRRACAGGGRVDSRAARGSRRRSPQGRRLQGVAPREPEQRQHRADSAARLQTVTSSRPTATTSATPIGRRSRAS